MFICSKTLQALLVFFLQFTWKTIYRAVSTFLIFFDLTAGATLGLSRHDAHMLNPTTGTSKECQ